KIKVPVIVMAGGKGTRLEPFTKILPKPLIPVNDKPILELIIEEFRRQGGKKYYLILNSKGEMIKAYFNGIQKDYELKYVWESDFLGTAGGLRLLKKLESDIFIVTNCDVIVKADYQQVIKLHKKQNASMTILSSIQHHKIPYGVISFREKGSVTDIHEKPEYTLTINTGIYVLNKDILKLIPRNEYFDMTDLIKTLIDNDKKVITYPVNENDYIDIGQWEEYKKAVEKLKVY
ncbi:MAG: NTP transferase domain-containing protein, partial [Thermodesulfovibrionia bacterium]|nr:NTP transferase domain-containing protein [Thermodesulfovibrionia bacterium]